MTGNSRGRQGWGARWVKVVVAVVYAAAAVLVAVAAATGANGGGDTTPSGEQNAPSGAESPRGGDQSPPSSSDTPPGGNHLSGGTHEALPCTGSREPVNFESFSAGPAPAGLPLSETVRRCDSDVPARESANYVSYIYGDCDIGEGADSCQPPLEIQSWPACERSMADYSFEGRPLPHRRLPKQHGAEVVEFELPIEPGGNRIEVYTRSVTVVIFSIDGDLARKAVGLLRSQEKGTPPATDEETLEGGPPERLAPPTEGSMDGVLSCRS